MAVAVPHPEEEREGVTVTVLDSVPLPVAHAQGVALTDTVPVGPTWVPLPHPDTVALKVMDALGLNVPVPQCVEVGHWDTEGEPVADRVPVGVMDRDRVLQLEGVKEGEGEVLPHPVGLRVADTVRHPDPVAVAHLDTDPEPVTDRDALGEGLVVPDLHTVGETVGV